MKKLILVSLSLMFFAAANAQTDLRKQKSFGVSIFFNDFQTAANIRKNGLSKALRDKQVFKKYYQSSGFAISYLEGLTKNVDFAATLGGSFPAHMLRNSAGDNLFFLEGTAMANVKLLPDSYVFVPFFNFGAGVSSYGPYVAAFAPVGVGFQLKLADGIFVLLNSQYHIPVTESASFHFNNSLGIVAPFSARKPRVVPVVNIPVVVTDRDGDGVVDSLDACPDTPGLVSLQGCPDRDNDGIADKDDKCPDVAGLAKYQGCPIPDTDGDGINDEVDKCPTVPGVARYQGCPIPDTDRDGVNDEEDKCPNEAGPASNFGCPVIEQAIIERVNVAAKNVFFATGSSKLLAKSYASLNNVVAVLNDNPSFKIDIEGHTDITGKADKNMILSQDRANSVMAYLKSKGIDESRMTATGFGITKPVADNKTAAGRAKNRRVEMKLRNY